MVASARFLPFLFLLGLATIGYAQRPAAEYGVGRGGQGGFGGSFGGSAGSFGGGERYLAKNVDGSWQSSRPEDDQGIGIWSTKTAILTPGDRYEIKLHAKAGDTVMAAATSDAFDPALEVDDKAGQVLAKNDDREDGDQSPFLICHFDKEGDYLLKVLSYRSVSGGKFTVRVRQFTPVDVSVGTDTRADLKQPVPGMENRVVVRIHGKKDTIYDCAGVRPENYGSVPALRIIGPTGVNTNDFSLIETMDRTTAFTALADGDYYVEYNLYGGWFRPRVDIVTPRAMKTDDSVTLNLRPNELAILDWPVTTGTIVRTSLNQAVVWQSLDSPQGQTGVLTSNDPRCYGDTPSFAWFRTHADSDFDVVRLFHAAGRARLLVRGLGTAQKLTVANSTNLPVWQPGVPVRDNLKIGESKLYVLRSGKSELTRVAASAQSFELVLDLFDANGKLSNSMVDRSNHSPKDELYYPEAGNMIVRLSCEGYGGSGSYEMKRELLAAKAYALGSPETVKLDAQSFGLYTVDLEIGKRYEFVTDNGNGLDVDLLDSAGNFIQPAAMAFDKVHVRYYVPITKGKHRLWLRGAQGSYRFRLSPNVPPKLG